MNEIKLEIAVFNYESAVIAEQCGADRIELCENYSAGGITPQPELIRKVKSKLKIPARIMIRPRAGNFIYNDSEFEEMKNSINHCSVLGMDGVVFGVLEENNLIDKRRCTELVQLAKPMHATFHRAFDEVKNPVEALEEIIECGFDRILTSGQKQTAVEGAKIISELIIQAKERIIIMPGGGVRAENILEIKNRTGAKEFHSAAVNLQTMLPEENEIRQMKNLLSL